MRKRTAWTVLQIKRRLAWRRMRRNVHSAIAHDMCAMLDISMDDPKDCRTAILGVPTITMDTLVLCEQ